jgi:hypothetical protein
MVLTHRAALGQSTQPAVGRVECHEHRWTSVHGGGAVVKENRRAVAFIEDHLSSRSPATFASLEDKQHRNPHNHAAFRWSGGGGFEPSSDLTARNGFRDPWRLGQHAAQKPEVRRAARRRTRRRSLGPLPPRRPSTRKRSSRARGGPRYCASGAVRHSPTRPLIERQADGSRSRLHLDRRRNQRSQRSDRFSSDDADVLSHLDGEWRPELRGRAARHAA